MPPSPSGASREPITRRRREQDEVLDHELALDGEQERVPVAERDVREQHEHEERAGHLQHEERQRDPHQPARQEAEPDEDLHRAERRHDDVGIEPVDRLGDEAGHRGDVEDLQQPEPEEHHADGDPQERDADPRQERAEPVVESLRLLPDVGLASGSRSRW